MASSWEIVASSSSSSLVSPPQLKYDVFLSFSGVDTRKNFTDHLLAALERRGIYTFRDDTKLDRGEDIKHELPKAIEESRISIVVFSKNYAASEWCLDELVKIMECKKSFQQIVLPIYYDIKPSEVREQTGRVAEALAEHKKCDKVEEWRKTLTEIADLSGRVLENEASGHEAKFIQTIVEDVEKKLNLMPLHVANHPVGMESRLQCVTELLHMESNDARVVAIWGIGGIGKTTIAKAAYNNFHRQFEGCSFIADIREISKNGLVVLQKHLLSDILGKEYLNIGNSHQGIEVIKRRVFCQRLLLVLDDVDHVDQLKALAIDQNFLYPGSRIIITTRDISSLNSLKLVDEIYMPEELNEDESLQLFSRHAFKEDSPMEDYIELSKEVVHYCRGVPLVLEVLGCSSLFKKTKSEWRSAITELKKIPHKDVQKKLQISFDSLSEGRKQLFLDIACFFAGMDRDFTIKILEGCDFHPVIGIRDLADKCLINSHSLTNNRIVMHDVLRGMGKEIVRQESIEEPGRRSRLWDPKDSLQVLRDGTGTETIQGLFLNLLKPKEVPAADAKDEDFFQNLTKAKDVEADAKAFEKMKRLRLLHLNFVHLTVSVEHISKRLVWLSWKGFPLTCVPSNLSLENLVTLDLSYSKLKKVWKKSKILEKLKFLHLSHCYYLTKTPDLSGLNNLEKLLLNNCIRLVEVHESVTCLDKLLVLNMENCRNLRKLPWGIWMLKSLECLNLSNCCKLGNFNGFNGSPSKSRYSFLLSWRSRAKSVNSIGLSQASVQGLSCMKSLYLRNCNLSHVPSEIGNLISLTDLDLSRNKLRTFPIGICNLTRLEILRLRNCRLSHIPSEFGNLISLRDLNLSDNKFRTLPDEISNFTCLESLEINQGNVSHLPNGISSLISLRNLDLGADNLPTFPNGICYLTRLKSLHIKEHSLSCLSKEIGCLSSLKRLGLWMNNLRTLPDSIGNLTQLEVLQLRACSMLRLLPALPESIKSVGAEFCASLESISMQSNWLNQVEMSFEGCSKLAETLAAKNFRERLLNYTGLSSIRNPITLRFFGELVPTWIEYQSIGSCLSLVVPPLVNHKLLGLILYTTFTFQEDDLYMGDASYRINNNTSKGFGRASRPYFHWYWMYPHDETWFSYIPLCYTEMQIEDQGKVEISIIKHGEYLVKHWGVTPIYEVDNTNTEANDGSLIKYTSSLTYQHLAEEIGPSTD